MEEKMKFLESVEPLLKAAEEYAAAVATLDPEKIRPAESKLHEAAMKYAEWGKRPQ
jgi:hypothetical protein